MLTIEFDYFLPPELIAQVPAPQRDQSRLMVLDRHHGAIHHRNFPDLLEYLRPGDVLVLNDSKVLQARLRGCHSQSGGEFELLLLEENAWNDWWVMLRPGKRAPLGTKIILKKLSGQNTDISATVVEINSEGHRRLTFSGTSNILESLTDLGEIPLPPYIKRKAVSELENDLDRYQTIYAQAAGSVAAPTAGLHFTKNLLEKIRALGVRICYVTLHVGLGTFAPVKAETLSEHVMHEERYFINPDVAHAVNDARRGRHRIIAVGTTSLRVLESAAAVHQGQLVPGTDRTRIFIHPPFQFQIVDALLTNFHLPRSTLLMLISAFAAPGQTSGREIIRSAYAAAIEQRYRFFSYGDAMFIA